MSNSDAIVDYIATIAVKEDVQRSELVAQLQELFNEGTQSLVDWLFTHLQPKYASNAGQTFMDEFADANNDFNDEIKQMEQQVKLSSTVGAKSDSLQSNKPDQRIGGVGANMLMKACQDASQATKNLSVDKNTQQQQQRKIITLDKSNNGSNNPENTEQTSRIINTNDVFDRLKKRPIGTRDQSYLETDLETLIRKEGVNRKGGHHQQQQQEKVDITQRIRKPEKSYGGFQGSRKQEEVKLDPSSSSVIDLSSFRNNVRSKAQPDAHEDKEKKLVKCRHYPHCKHTDEECPYHHPQEQCEFFPKCTFGEKCLNIHPDIPCKFGISCYNPKCQYTHPKGRMASGAMNPAQLQKTLSMFMMASMGMMGNKPKSKKFQADQNLENPNPAQDTIQEQQQETAIQNPNQ
eukprot:403372361